MSVRRSRKPGGTTTVDRATFVCEGSVDRPHRPLWFTPSQARRGCPRGCTCEMSHKDHGVVE